MLPPLQLVNRPNSSNVKIARQLKDGLVLKLVRAAVRGAEVKSAETDVIKYLNICERFGYIPSCIKSLPAQVATFTAAHVLRD